MSSPQLRERLIVSAGGEGDCTTIAAALAAAAPGALVEILPGRYRESLELTAPVTLAARGDRGQVVVEAPGGAPALRVDGERVTLEGLTLSSSGHALLASGATLTLQECDLQGAASLDRASASFADCSLSGTRPGSPAAPGSPPRTAARSRPTGAPSPAATSPE